MRVGHGYDVHRFTDGDHLFLGGVKIPHTQALLAHSDGDVALHALCDALLGAAALGDIGHWFPDTDTEWKNADSRELLRRVYQAVNQAGFQLANADVTIIAQKPKIAPHITNMRTHIAEDLQCELSQINVKATTTEGLGYIGQEQGIASHAVVLLVALESGVPLERQPSNG